ncbi:Splicing factor YJU2 [Erysiphe necator]|uniref:Splicing factor YJU2 n=1 Tax=Uncinula necator TaxID=52586 RepID=A0A0B1P2G4_UNCNE|nr:Splicing factor YJU2 [Erysiphe necator]KHJ31535.1 putative mrna splicing protein yju2 [Erysiphe necator]
MSERKVLTKYYPPDFDPSKIVRTRGPKQAGPKVQTVRLMAPFPMKCTTCGEYIYKGRKFNARKETTEEKYYSISIYRFYIRCTRCSGEITFKTDPKNMDYECERGAKRNTEPWRMNGGGKQESDEERLDRLEREEEEKNAMQELESKTLDTKREIAVADALDEIRTRNARNERVGKDGREALVVQESIDEARRRQDQEDEEAARQAFMRYHKGLEEVIVDEIVEGDQTELASSSVTDIDEKILMPPPPPPIRPTFKRVVKKKKDHAALLGIKKKAPIV